MADLEKIKHAVTDVKVSETVLRRWSPRAFSPRPVSSDALKTIFTAASWAASSRNEQPWRFALGIKPSAIYMKILHALVPANQAWAEQAPVLFASFAKQTFAHNNQPNGTASHDVGAATATLSLEATRLGMHTHGMAGFDAQALQAALAVPFDYLPVACWALGYLGDASTLPDTYREQEKLPRERKALSDFLFAEWDQPAELG